MNTGHKLFLSVALGLALTCAAGADTTAFDLIKKGNDFIGVQSKDKVVQIHSDKSVASLTPNLWHVAYYDPDVTFKCVEVKFGGGEKMDVSHPVRPFQAAFKEREILDRAKLKVDSDKALKIAAAQPLVKNLTLKASKMTLNYSDAGPVWKVQLWAARLKNPNKDADIGELILSATDGSVVKSGLRPDKVD